MLSCSNVLVGWVGQGIQLMHWWVGGSVDKTDVVHWLGGWVSGKNDGPALPCPVVPDPALPCPAVPGPAESSYGQLGSQSSSSSSTPPRPVTIPTFPPAAPLGPSGGAAPGHPPSITTFTPHHRRTQCEWPLSWGAGTHIVIGRSAGGQAHTV